MELSFKFTYKDIRELAEADNEQGVDTEIEWLENKLTEFLSGFDNITCQNLNIDGPFKVSIDTCDIGEDGCVYVELNDKATLAMLPRDEIEFTQAIPHRCGNVHLGESKDIF